MLDKLEKTVDYLRTFVPEQTDIGIILGTGLGGLVHIMTEKEVIPYSDIPNFPRSTVEGHVGNFVIGKLGSKSVVAMEGRFHYYEGYNMEQVTYPVRVMQLLGIKTLIVSNAAGGMNSSFSVGDIMLITDHINLFPEHPLRGKNIDELGTRFPDMNNAYDNELSNIVHEVAEENNITLKRGIYVGTSGPTYETPAEIRYMKIIGGDAVGMSTVPEVIVARHAGMRVLGFSVITDMALGYVVQDELNHKEVQDAARTACPLLRNLIQKTVEKI